MFLKQISVFFHQRPNPVLRCLIATTWSFQPPWTTAPMSCLRRQFGLQGATAWAPVGSTVTPEWVAGRAWPAGLNASWRDWFHARTCETGIGGGTGRWAATGAARSSARSPAPATTSAHCDTHRIKKAKRRIPTHTHTEIWGRGRCKKENGK